MNEDAAHSVYWFASVSDYSLQDLWLICYVSAPLSFKRFTLDVTDVRGEGDITIKETFRFAFFTHPSPPFDLHTNLSDSNFSASISVSA